MTDDQLHAREQWVSKRALEIQAEHRHSGNCCSSDHARVTAYNEFHTMQSFMEATNDVRRN